MSVAEAAAVLPLGFALLFALWLCWRWPTAFFMVVLLSLAVRIEAVLHGNDIHVGLTVQQVLVLGALLVNAARFGVHARFNWPAAALVLMFLVSLATGQVHAGLTEGFMGIVLLMMVLPWLTMQVVLAPGSRPAYAATIASIALLSVAIGACLHVTDVRSFIDHEHAGALRLRGALGLPADLALLGFAGLAAAIHEFVRTGHRSFGALATVNLAIVILTGTRMAMVASGLLLWGYYSLVRQARQRVHEHYKPALAAAAVVVIAGLLYFPELQQRVFDARGSGLQMSGRDEIWSFYFEEFLHSPLVGYGIGTGLWAGDQVTTFGLPAPHNEYLHILVSGGLLGFVLFFGGLYLWFRSYYEIMAADDRAYLNVLLPVLAIYAVTENLLLVPAALPIYAYLTVMQTRSSRELSSAVRDLGSGEFASRRTRRARTRADSIVGREQRPSGSRR